MVKVSRMEKAVAEEAIESAPHRKAGQWKTILADLLKTQSGAKITDLTRGQVAALIRQAKVDGFHAVAIDKYTAVLLSPPKPKSAPSK